MGRHEKNISVIIPVYNEIDTLPALVRALFGQTAQPSEIIFVDSGSSDGTVEYLNSLSSASTVLKIVMNFGGLPGGNRNVGVQASKGSYISFIDAGMVPDSNWLLELSQLSEHYECIYGLCHFMSSSPMGMAVCAASYGLGAKRPVLPGSMFSRNAVLLTGPFNPNLRAAEDKIWIANNRKVFNNYIVATNTVATYSFFPMSVNAVVKKWWVYQKCDVEAGIYSKYNLIVTAFYLGVFLAEKHFSLMLILGYYFLRSFVDPLRRSAPQSFFKNLPRLYHLLYIPILIDAVKLISFWRYMPIRALLHYKDRY